MKKRGSVKEIVFVASVGLGISNKAFRHRNWYGVVRKKGGPPYSIE